MYLYTNEKTQKRRFCLLICKNAAEGGGLFIFL